MKVGDLVRWCGDVGVILEIDDTKPHDFAVKITINGTVFRVKKKDLEIINESR